LKGSFVILAFLIIDGPPLFIQKGKNWPICLIDWIQS
jgi:hypothetical protein